MHSFEPPRGALNAPADGDHMVSDPQHSAKKLDLQLLMLGRCSDIAYRTARIEIEPNSIQNYALLERRRPLELGWRL
jgi:hypothetical protein